MSDVEQAAEQALGQPFYSDEDRLKDSLADVSRIFDELLCAASGLQEVGSLAASTGSGNVNIGFLVESMGRHVQHLRNEAAQRLELAYKKLGVDTINS